LQHDPTNAAALAEAHTVLGPNYITELIALTHAPPSVISFMTAHGAAVAEAQAKSPGQWRDYYWICFGGAVAFLPAALLMRGRWSPKRARQDQAEHEARVTAELVRLHGGEA
jgi:hypothetical protein